MDPYKVLQVDPSAEPEVINAAYKSLAKNYHPDVNHNPDEASRMQEINLAYEILSNPDKRRAFDEEKKSNEHDTPPNEAYKNYHHASRSGPIPVNISGESRGLGVCQSCGSVGEIKKSVIRRNIGLIITRLTGEVNGYLCRDCISYYFWKYTAITLCFGWWGVISFLVSPFLIVANFYNYIISLSLPRISDDKKSSLVWQLLVFLVIGFATYQLFILPYNSGNFNRTANPSTTTKISSSEVNNLVPTDDVYLFGQYSCTKYYAGKADEIKPFTSEDALTQREIRLNILVEELDNLQKRIDENPVDSFSSQSRVDLYNSLVDQYNLKLATYKSNAKTYDEDVARYNKEVDIYNAYLEENCTRRY